MTPSFSPSRIRSINAAADAALAAAQDAGGWLAFDRYLDIVLHHPQHGYYGGGRVQFGGGGDFYTAPGISPLFGAALGGQIAGALAGGGGVLELGGGDGALAAQIIPHLPRAAGYAILETSAALRARQQERLRDFDNVKWLQRLPEEHAGVIIANEVLDCVPFRLLRKSGGGWRELGVVAGDGGGLALAARAAADIPEYLTRAPLPDGYQTEISPRGEALTATLAGVLRRGYLLFFDYGFGRAEYYHPQRAGGTMMCHSRQRADDNALADAGEKDITAHVDFTAIAEAGARGGAVLAGYTTQAHFLINAGILDLLAAHTGDDVRYAKLAAGVNKLLAPQEMGELFKCIAFRKGDMPPLPAFAAGDMRHRL